jgi:acetyltransferase-like isoleucine patch superfamily enzyme
MSKSTPRQKMLHWIHSFFDHLLAIYFTHLNRAKIWLWSGKFEKGFRSTGPLFLRNLGSFTIGKSFRCNSGRRVNIVGGDSMLAIRIAKKASLCIGDNVGISSSTIACHEKIVIGNNVLIGGGCEIFDTDFHTISPNERTLPKKRPKSSPIFIGNDVFIGAGTTVLKGVTIGEGAVIGAKSLVTKDIPAFEIWGGSPARKLRDLR